MKKLQGCYPNLSNEEYHADNESISRSVLMDFDKSPYTYWANHINPERPKKESTPQMEFGTAFHTLILEPDLFGEQYFVMPEKVLKKENADLYEINKKMEEQAEKTCKKVLSRSDYQRLRDMSFALQRNKEAIELIQGAIYESSYFWKDEDSELMLKCRPDILHANIIVDLKTCANASPYAFQRAMIDGGYHIQGAMIRDAVEKIEGNRINNVINICIETKYPYNIGIYIIDEYALDAGEEKYKQLCINLKHAINTQTFQDFGVQTIGLPKWAS